MSITQDHVRALLARVKDPHTGNDLVTSGHLRGIGVDGDKVAVELVLGYPKNMDGTVGPRAEKAAAFGQMLRQLTGLPVTLWDERRTTIDAHNILFQNGQNAKKRKKTVDAVAAALMLEGYLTRRRLEAQK